MDSQTQKEAIPPTNYLDMNELLTHLFSKIEKLEDDVRHCNKQHLEATQFQNGALVRALERNTQVLEEIQSFLKKKRA